MRRFIFPLLFAFSTLVLFYACRKMEAPEALQSAATSTERFFAVSPTAPAEVKAIVEALKKQNEAFNFLASVIKEAGYPRWDNAKVVNIGNEKITGRGAADAPAGELVYVPFALDTANQVGAVLRVQMNPTDTAYRLLYANRYRSFGYDTTHKEQWNARNVFHLFASFDHAVFGHTSFLINDDSLFKRKTDSSIVKLTLKTIGAVNGRATLYSYMECAYFTYCDIVLDPVKAARTTGSTECWDIDICTTYSYDGGSGSSGGGWTGSGDGTGGASGGGGGSGSDGWWSGGGSVPCDGVVQRSARLMPTDCGTGWVPEETTYDNYTNTEFNLPFPGDNQNFVAENPDATDCHSFSFTTTSSGWQEAGLKNVKIRIIYTDLSQIRRSVFVNLNQIVIGFSTRWSSSKAQNIAAKAIDYARDNTFEYFRTKDYVDPASVEIYFREQIDKIVRQKGGTASRIGTGNPNITFNESKATGFFDTPYDC